LEADHAVEKHRVNGGLPDLRIFRRDLLDTRGGT
jgi:hypothetical protein